MALAHMVASQVFRKAAQGCQVKPEGDVAFACHPQAGLDLRLLALPPSHEHHMPARTVWGADHAKRNELGSTFHACALIHSFLRIC